jgi:hypothetical protein
MYVYVKVLRWAEESLILLCSGLSLHVILQTLNLMTRTYMQMSSLSKSKGDDHKIKSIKRSCV